MMEYVRKDVPFQATDELLCDRLHTELASEIFERAALLRQEVASVIRPAYIMKEVRVGRKSRNGIELGGQFFGSRIAASKIAADSRVVVYIATCGREAAELLAATDDPFDNYVLDTLAHIGCNNARDDMLRSLSARFGIKKYISLAPGSVIDWNVAEVCKFFEITDGLHQPLGIRVLESGLIDPLKSVSGIFVESDEKFETCDLCMIPDCPSRRSPFDEEKYNEALSL